MDPHKVFLLALMLIWLPTMPGAAERRIAPGRFGQKVAAKYPASAPLRAMAVCSGRVFVGTDEGVMELEKGNWSRPASAGDAVRGLACAEGGVAVITAQGMMVWTPGGGRPTERYDLAGITAVVPWEDGYLAGTRHGLYRLRGGRAEAVAGSGGGVTALAVGPDGRAYVGRERGLAVFDGTVMIPVEGGGGFSGEVRGLAFDGAGHLYGGTGRGLLRWDPGGGCKLITGREGLPCEDVISVAADGQVVWVGTSQGAARFDGREWQYLQGREYLLDDRVAGLAVTSDGGAWIAAGAGVSRVEYRMMTLSEKARHFETVTRLRHVRYGLVSDSRLQRPGDLSTNTAFTSDNDGLWTAMYIAAECYRFAVTKEPEALEYARESLSALMFLEEVNGIPGFISRSFARPDEPHDQGEWDHFSPDGKWRWKGDTSSDEVVGHYYAYSIYYDLCADLAEQEQIREKVRRITDYIIAHDYFLIDTDGRPTTWGRWNFYRPFYRRYRFWDRGLNSLEILSHLKTAYHITGDEKYQQAYLELALRRDYAKFTVRQKLNLPGAVNHSDDELAFLSYYPLLKYETDPTLLKFYRRSLSRSFAIERPERCPLWNFIYAAVMPGPPDFDLQGALFTLQRISLDLVRWDHLNSRRADITLRPVRGRFQEKESVVPLPPDERSVMKWNGNPYALDTGDHGLSEEAGTFWLLPYWMGRYYGFIEE